MVRRFNLAVAFLFLLPSTAFPASLFLSPVQQTIDGSCEVSVSAILLEYSSAFDIEITWDKNIVECTSVRTIGASPPFQLFRSDIDNETGRLEVLLVHLSKDGYTGSADSLLVLTFVPVSTGTSQVVISQSWPDECPVLVDKSNDSIDIETSGATITVGTTVDVEEPLPPITAVRLHQNYPNPFNPRTAVRFDLPSSSAVFVRIFDANGRLVRTLINGRKYAAGSWEEDWNGRNDSGKQVPSGVYFCVLKAAGKTESRKMVMLR